MKIFASGFFSRKHINKLKKFDWQVIPFKKDPSLKGSYLSKQTKEGGRTAFYILGKKETPKDAILKFEKALDVDVIFDKDQDGCFLWSFNWQVNKSSKRVILCSWDIAKYIYSMGLSPRELLNKFSYYREQTLMYKDLDK